MLCILLLVDGSPISKPYIPFRTSPLDQEGFVHHVIHWEKDMTQSQIRSTTSIPPDRCPLQFSLGISKRWHEILDGASINQPPIIRSIFPAVGPGKQVLYTTQYEHLDLLSPALYENIKGTTVQEVLVQAPGFPMLWESSSFHSSPILHDVNGDGITDVIVADYDGLISVMGLAQEPGKTRYFHHAQAPRLYLRRDWVESRILQELNHSYSTHHQDPFHSYFEYYSNDADKDNVLRGVTANVLDQDETSAKLLQERRSRKVSHADDVKKEIVHPNYGDLPQNETQNEQQGMGHTNIEPNQEQHQNHNNGDPTPVVSNRKEPDMDSSSSSSSSLGEQTNLQRSIPGHATSNGHDFHNHVVKQNSVLHHVEHFEDRGPDSSAAEMMKPDGKRKHLHATSNGHDFHNHIVQQNSVVHHVEHVENREINLSRDNVIKNEGEPQTLSDPQYEVPGVEHHVGNEEEMRHRRLQEETNENNPGDQSDDGLLAAKPKGVDGQTGDDMYTDDATPETRNAAKTADDDFLKGSDGSDGSSEDLKANDEKHSDQTLDDPHGGRHHADDDYRRYAEYDDYYRDRVGRDHSRDNFYDSGNYIRIPPHILSTPVMAEVPRLYGEHDVDDILLVAATYFFDEDEYEGKFSYKRFTLDDHGDESEVKRGMYVATSILAYSFEYNGRWAAQTHLDLSTDFSAPENVTIVGSVPILSDVTQMGAFALGSPTVADIDGDGTPDVLVGTSMGFLYVMDARNLLKKEHWPIQMRHPIEVRPLVEDVVGDANLEIFVMDRGGNIACFSHQAQLLWHRNILDSLLRGMGDSISAASPMSLGDVDGDGFLDLVVTVKIDRRWFVCAFDAASGKDLTFFPMSILQTGTKSEAESENIREFVAQPLLVDLHSDQSHLLEYVRRGSGRFKRSERKVTRRDAPTPQGGLSEGLHIVQPIEKELYIIEAGSGCTQKVVIGDDISAMVQVDDIHGTNHLDLLVATKSGNVITLETQASYHPLNTWTGGSLRTKSSHSHGYSASQGVFIHEISRQYKDVFGVYVPITFEIFDNRPSVRSQTEKKYKIEIRDGSSPKRVLQKAEYSAAGVYTERVYIRYGPGYYTLCVILTTSAGILHEDCFATGYNVHFMGGFGTLLWLPLLLAALTIVACGVKKANWDDDDDSDYENRNQGILGRALPT